MSRQFSCTWLAALVLCLALKAAEQAHTKRQLDALLESYKAYGLPLPPANAKLVRYYATHELGGPGTGMYRPSRYDLGFLVRARTKDEKDQLLTDWLSHGVMQHPMSEYPKWEVVEPKPGLAASVELFSCVIAIQCHARGWTQLAQELLERCEKNEPVAHERQLALTAWTHWTWNLSDPKADWDKLVGQLKVILDREPKAFEPHHRRLLHSMELALRPSKAKAGSIEALLNELAHEKMETGMFVLDDHNVRYLKVGMTGFEAVPALIAHLDDERLTRTTRQGFNNFPSWNYRVQHLVSDLLQDLAGQDLGKDWLRRQQAYVVDKADAEAWWKEASGVGEEPYFARHVLGQSTDARWPNALMLKIIAKKYPRQLEPVYRKMLAERPNMVGWPVADAVTESTLSREKQRDIFLMVAAAKNMDQRCDALWKLKDIDPIEFNAIMIATLEEIANAPTTHHLRYAHLTQHTTNANIWAALRKTAERAAPAQRLEYLDTMVAHVERKLAKKQQLQFLAHFFEDTAVGYYGWSGFGSLEVRNMAAWRIASILKTGDEPRRDWAEAQWAELRQKVRGLLAHAGVR